MRIEEVLRAVLGSTRVLVPVAVGVVVVAFVLGMQRGPASSENIVIKDANGQKRMEIGIFDDKPAIVMFDRKGRQRLWLGIFIEQDDASQVALQFHKPGSDNFTTELCAMYKEASREQDSFLSLDGPRGIHAGIAAGAPCPQVQLQGDDRDGRNSVKLAVVAGHPLLALSDKDMDDRLIAKLTSPEGSPCILMKDKADKTIWRAPPAPDNSEPKGSDKEKRKPKKQE